MYEIRTCTEWYRQNFDCYQFISIKFWIVPIVIDEISNDIYIYFKCNQMVSMKFWLVQICISIKIDFIISRIGIMQNWFVANQNDIFPNQNYPT